jgi:hypothetical protein
VDLLGYIHELLDNQEENQLIWLHGTAGVGKSAIAFTVAERMRGLKVTEQTNVEKRLAGTFFFSRKHTDRCTTGYFFATLVYQLASNFPSIRADVNRAIRENPSLLDPDKSLHDQMEAFFLKPLRKLRPRLRGCEPLTFVVDALDECTSSAELADLITFLASALREPDLPVTHILLTSRSESHICKVFQQEEVRPLVCEIPVQTSREGVATIISLDGVDVDNDIYIFLRHSFSELESRHPDFPQPSRDILERLASRAGRRFIVASTMMNFIDDEDNDPRDRLQLMLELTSDLLPGTEVHRLYDSILSTCADPKRAYTHLSVVAALADPLPMLQISKLLGPGLGRDVEVTLMQLRSVMNIPTDSALPVDIYHSSVRDYVSDPSNCNLAQVHDIPSPHSLLALSSFRLMIKEIPESTAILDALSELKTHSHAMQPHDPKRLKESLSFLVLPPQPLSVLISLLWIRGDCSPDLQPWLKTLDGRAWLQTQGGDDWLQTQGGEDWLRTRGGAYWMGTQSGQKWLRIQCLRYVSHAQSGQQTEPEHNLLQAQGQDYLLTGETQDSTGTQHGRSIQEMDARTLLRTLLQTQGEPQTWLQTMRGRGWLQILRMGGWLWIPRMGDWLRTPGGRHWLRTTSGQDWLQTTVGRNWLQTTGGQDWLQETGGREWLLRMNGNNWLQTPGGRDWLQMNGGRDWLQRTDGLGWLRTSHGSDWLQTQGGRDWLDSQDGQDWFQAGQDWLRTEGGQDWLQTTCGRDWLQRSDGRNWVWSQRGRDWLRTQPGQDWLQTEGGRDWLQRGETQFWIQVQCEQGWLQTPPGRDWLQTERGLEWLQTQGGRDWLLTPEVRDWLQTQSGREWLQTPDGRAWQSTPAAFFWVMIEEFSSTMEAISEYEIFPEFFILPAFQVVQQFKSLPDFLMLPTFLALTYPDHSTSRSSNLSPPNREIIHAMNAFMTFASEAHKQSRLASDALHYACHHWAVHLSRAPNPWDDMLDHTFQAFWNRHLLSWLQTEWCLKGLRSCLVILSKAQELAKVCAQFSRSH